MIYEIGTFKMGNYFVFQFLCNFQDKIQYDTIQYNTPFCERKNNH